MKHLAAALLALILLPAPARAQSAANWWLHLTAREQELVMQGFALHATAVCLQIHRNDPAGQASCCRETTGADQYGKGIPESVVAANMTAIYRDPANALLGAYIVHELALMRLTGQNIDAALADLRRAAAK